jgi:hypothetical protein
MSVRRVVPNIRSSELEGSSAFYRLLGFEEVMNLGWIVTLASPTAPGAQISVMGDDATPPMRSYARPAPRSSIRSRTRSGASAGSSSATRTGAW